MPTEPAREMNAEMRALLKKSKPNAPQEPDTLKSGSTDPTDLVRSNHQIPRLVMGLAIGAVILGVIVLLAKGLG